MKKLMIVLVFLLVSISTFSQYISEAEARELFRERFISTSEAGYPDILDIPFSKEDLLYDRISWLIPLNINGALQYRLVQARYIANEYQSYDTLTLNEAEEVINLTQISHRNFPNDESIKFFRTKNKAISNEGLEFQKTLFCFDKSYNVVNLPLNTSIVLIQNDSMSYIIENEKEVILEINVGNNSSNTTRGFSVLTLIFLN